MKENCLSMLIIHDHSGYILLDITNIVCCKADGNYSTIYLKEEPPVFVCKKLKQLDKLISSTHFIRSSRSHLVYMHLMKGYHRREKNLVLEGKHVVPVTRRKQKIVLSWLRKHATLIYKENKVV